jgi:hypothetical protein
MVKVQGTNIYMTRGDTATINLSIKDDNKIEYELMEGDVVVFSVKKEMEDKGYVIQKTFVDKTIVIEHEDTKNLDFGKYVYDIQLTFIDGKVSTIITPSDLVLEGEVHN